MKNISRYLIITLFIFQLNCSNDSDPANPDPPDPSPDLVYAGTWKSETITDTLILTVSNVNQKAMVTEYHYRFINPPSSSCSGTGSSTDGYTEVQDGKFNFIEGSLEIDAQFNTTADTLSGSYIAHCDQGSFIAVK